MGKLENIDPHELTSLVRRGIVRVMLTQELPVTIEEQPEFQRHASIKGTPISLSSASRKYDVPLVTIHQWVKRGYIPVIGQDKNRILIDEAYLAYCADIRRERPGQGRWLFNEDGTPYTPKTC